ncbi:hypothetical protein ACGFZL_19870 [Streptomyces sp. NPDC048182]|uniref:hypothetical protein n=1 Tax=Streptomyces sp. NPDC048182 TaxID=3365507 RepID=UPI003720FCF2
MASGATTAVGLMVTDAWGQAKQRFVALFSRGGDPAAADGELDRAREALLAAAGTDDEEALVADITAMVRLRLRGLLRQDPGAADELRDLVSRFAPGAGDSVHNSISGGTVHGPVFQGHTFSDLTFHRSDGPAADRTD